MFCKDCGNEVPNDSLFCPNCGSRNEKSSPSGNTKRCETCKKEFTGDQLFCDSCGGVLVQGNALQGEKQQPQQVYSSSPNPPNHVHVPPYAQNSSAYGAQVPPNATPQMPQYSTYAANPVKKKSKVVPIFLTAFLVTIGIAAVLIISNGIADKKQSNVPKDSPVTNNTNPTGSIKDPLNTSNGSELNYLYSYTELPDVVSLDSDKRFIYSTIYNEDGIVVYTYLFYDENASDADFYRACEDYSQLIQVENSFVYEKEYTEQQYEQTGEAANYLTRDDYGLSITAGIEDSLRYAFITIFPLSDESPSNDTPQVTLELPNYNSYLVDREIKVFTYDETVNMDNGLSFAIYDVVANYPGDGTMTIDITLDLSSYGSGYYMNNGDFMVVPTDNEGYIIADAQPISYITDSTGKFVAMPFLVKASSYDRLTFTYPVPINTMAFTIYGTNFLANQATPVYVMDVGFE